MNARDRADAATAATENDAGITLIEVVTAMAIMSIFMAIFTAGILQIYRVTNHDEASADARAQINIAFLRLDTELRYAAGISTPAPVGSNSYVEYLVANTATPTCVELRLNTAARQLQRRTWPQGTSPVAPSSWTVLASNVSSSQPFTVTAADATYSYQRLTFQLTANVGTGPNAASAQTTVAFTALNSSADVPSTAVCTEGRAVP